MLKKRRRELMRTPSLDYDENVLLSWTNTSYYTPASTPTLSIVCEKEGYAT
jgi:hypothetical protein